MKIPILCLALSGLVLSCAGQSYNRQEVDSMRRALQHSTSDTARAMLMSKISVQWAATAPDSAMQMAREGLSLATGKGSEVVKALCLRSVGWCFLKKNAFDSAEWYMNLAIGMLHANKDDWDEARTLVNITSIYDLTGNNEKSMSCLLRAVPLMEKTNDLLGKIGADNRIANAYILQNLFENARPYALDAVQLCRRLNKEAYLGAALLLLGRSYRLPGNYDTVFLVFRQSREANHHINFLIGEGATVHETGTVFLKKSNNQLKHPDTDSALYYQQAAYKIYTQVPDLFMEAYEKMMIGETLILLKRFREAARDLAETLPFFIRERSFSYANESAFYLSKAYRELGEYKPAIDAMEQASVFKDSADAMNRKEAMASMFARYETDKKDRTIQLLNAQQALTEKELSRNRLIVWFSIALVVLVIALVIVLWKQARTRSQLKEVKMRNQISGDLHDDIGSSLSSILLLSNMAARHPEQAGSRQALDKIGLTAKEVMEKMNEIVWTMNPMNDKGASIKERMEKLAAQVQEVSPLEIRVDVSDGLDDLKVPMELRKNIFLIFKEALNNIVKHAHATQAELTIGVDNRQIRMRIRDNGTGFDAGQQRRGNGLGTMVQRARACGGDLQVTTAPGQGTLIEVILPAPHSRYRYS